MFFDTDESVFKFSTVFTISVELNLLCVLDTYFATFRPVLTVLNVSAKLSPLMTTFWRLMVLRVSAVPHFNLTLLSWTGLSGIVVPCLFTPVQMWTWLFQFTTWNLALNYGLDGCQRHHFSVANIPSFARFDWKISAYHVDYKPGPPAILSHWRKRPSFSRLIEWNGVISGSTALQFFAHILFKESDLDVYVPLLSLRLASEGLSGRK